MIVVACANQVAELGPRLEGRKSDVRRDETLSLITNERCQLGSLLRIERDVTMSEKDDRIDIGEARSTAGGAACCHQRFVGNDVGIGTDVGVVSPRLIAEPLDHRERVRCRIVLRDAVARVSPREDRFPNFRASRTAPRSSTSLVRSATALGAEPSHDGARQQQR